MRQMDAIMTEIEKLANKIALQSIQTIARGLKRIVTRIVERFSSLRYNIKDLNQLIGR